MLETKAQLKEYELQTELKIAEFKKQALEEKLQDNNKTQSLQKEIEQIFEQMEKNYRAEIEQYKKDIDGMAKFKADSEEFAVKNAKL